MFILSLEFSSLVVSRLPSFTLTNITAPNDGTSYQCVASNDAGFDIQNTTLYITPTVLTHPQSAMVLAGLNWVISCEAEAFPFPSYQWQKMNMSSEYFEDITGEMESTLSFQPIRHRDNGMYRCVASNWINGSDYSDVSRQAQVIVLPVIESTIASTSLTIVWSPPFGEDDINNYTVTISPLGLFNTSLDEASRNQVLRCLSSLQRSHVVTVDSDGTTTRANLTSLGKRL